MTSAARRPKPVRRRTVARRVLYSFTIVMIGFALVAGWSVIALQDAARDAQLMRSGYLPLSLALRDLVAAQENWNAQLNNITTAPNPADTRVWFDWALRFGRPKSYAKVRSMIAVAYLDSRSEPLVRIGHELMSEVAEIEQFVSGDRESLTILFEALERGDTLLAERERDRLVTRGSNAKKRVTQLEQRVARNVDGLTDVARQRERLATTLLIALSAFTALVGIGMALYARRVLQPLSAVTERANAVARGDLTPRPVPASTDEIGDLAQTFESMVAAIAQANARLLASERLATIGKMAAHVTHEIRNPLSSIALNVELLEEEIGPGGGEALALLRAIKQEIERLNVLSGQYLSVARQKPLALAEEDIGDLVREACEFMRGDLRRHNCALDLRLEGSLPKVKVEEAQIKQVLFNLLRNAREAMPEGGAVTVTVSKASGGGVDLIVEDEGVGIDPDTRSRLFEPFFTTKGKGTGLGLAITRQVIEAHSGTIACVDRQPRGTRFWVHLPDTGEQRPSEDDPAADRRDTDEIVAV